MLTTTIGFNATAKMTLNGCTVRSDTPFSLSIEGENVTLKETTLVIFKGNGNSYKTKSSHYSLVSNASKKTLIDNIYAVSKTNNAQHFFSFRKLTFDNNNKELSLYSYNKLTINVDGIIDKSESGLVEVNRRCRDYKQNKTTSDKAPKNSVKPLIGLRPNKAYSTGSPTS